jgi:hypothetical protein
MSKQEERERLFSEILDRILAGEHIEVSPDMDADLRSALEFAQQIVNTRPNPEAAFKASLKSRLVQKLAEEEARKQAKKQRWFYQVVRQPVWQATAVVILIGIVSLIVWASGVLTPAGVSGDILRVEADTNKTTYTSGEEILIEVSMKNTASEPFMMDNYPPTLSLMDESTGQAVYTFTAGDRAVTLYTGQETHFTLSWDQRDARGIPVSTGSYYIELEDIEQDGQAVRLSLSTPVRFSIRPY